MNTDVQKLADSAMVEIKAAMYSSDQEALAHLRDAQAHLAQAVEDLEDILEQN